MHHQALFFLPTSPGTSTSVPLSRSPTEAELCRGQVGASAVPGCSWLAACPSCTELGPVHPLLFVCWSLGCRWDLLLPAALSCRLWGAVGLCLHQRGHCPWVTATLSSLIAFPYGGALLLQLSDNADDQICSKY